MDLSSNCIFCKIIKREADATILYESDNIIIIKDIMPKAPVHVQVVAKQHIPSVNELTDADAHLFGEMVMAAKDYASKSGVAGPGFKLVVNTGKEGGQVIHHLHMHLLGGKQLEE